MRLAAQAKGGFYPTPPRVVDMIAELVSVYTGRYRSRETLRVLDPCCGAGEALAQLAQRLSDRWGIAVETSGVELHQDRAEQAAGRLTRSLASDLFATSIANGAFGLQLLNPPMIGRRMRRNGWSTASWCIAADTWPRRASWCSLCPRDA